MAGRPGPHTLQDLPKVQLWKLRENPKNKTEAILWQTAFIKDNVDHHF